MYQPQIYTDKLSHTRVSKKTSYKIYINRWMWHSSSWNKIQAARIVSDASNDVKSPYI